MLGRPKSMETRKIVSLPAELAQAIEDYRFANRMKTEAEAIRRLIELGLGKAPVGASPSGSTPGSTRKPAAAKKAAAPRTKKPTASDRQASPAGPSSREA